MWLFALASLTAILALTLQSAQGTTALSDWFRDLLLKAVPQNSPAARWICRNVRRLGHIPEYFLLGATTYAAMKATFPGKRVLLPALAICAAVSLGDQGVKGCLPTRHFDIQDLPMDFVGYCLGIGLAWAIGRIWKRE